MNKLLTALAALSFVAVASAQTAAPAAAPAPAPAPAPAAAKPAEDKGFFATLGRIIFGKN